MFFRYAVSGGLAAGTHFLVLILLVELMTWNPLMATMIGFAAAIGVNYTFQYHWTFASSLPHRKSLMRYIIVTLTMMAINGLIFWFLTEQLETNYILAQFFATCIVMLANFKINRQYTFASKN